jgi:cytochrome P450 family 142 subfamily A polypeptide 1
MSPTHLTRPGLNLLDGRWYAEDPHEVWRWMRHHAPVYFDETADVWGISKYDDVLAIEKDPVTFSSMRAPRPHGMHLPMMISMDDPEHRARRGLVNRGFTPRRIAEMEDTVAVLCRRIIDGISEVGSCDFVWDVAAPLPLMVIAELLGFDVTAHEDLLRWSDDLMRATTADPTPAQAKAGFDAMMGFREFQLRVIAQRRAEPRDDVISKLCQAELDGVGLDDESIVNEALLILIGGDETTRHVISGGMLALLERPDALAELAADPQLLPAAMEELLRWVSPVKNMARTATRDVEVRGQNLRQGDQLMLFYPSANRDDEIFARPDELDIRREPNPHLALGFGTHFCLGAALARLELRVMFREILTRLPDLALADPAAQEYRPSNFVSGLESMPMHFTPPQLYERAAGRCPGGGARGVGRGSRCRRHPGRLGC